MERDLNYELRGPVLKVINVMTLYWFIRVPLRASWDLLRQVGNTLLSIGYN